MDTASDPTRFLCNSRLEMGKLFWHICTEQEQSPALVTDSAIFSYKWLLTAAQLVQSHLCHANVQPHQVVALCIPPGPALVAAVMGCILHETAFVMIEPSLPKLRKKLMLETSKPSVLIQWMHSGDLGLAEYEYPQAWMFTAYLNEVNTLCIEPDQLACQGKAQTFACSDNTLYIMYTSGSTGQPKGVCASADGTLNRLSWMWDTYPFKKGVDVLCFKTSILFVDSIWEIIGGVLKGTTLAIPAPDTARDPKLLSLFIKRHLVTRLTVTPTLLRHLLELAGAPENLKTLDLCFVSGEPLSLALCSRFFSMLSACRLINLYGTTEICADATFFEVTAEYLSKSSGPLAPIGRPISNVSVEVVNAITGSIVHRENPLEQGELVVNGMCVADAYLNCSALAADSVHHNCKSFNTHDIVHYIPSGDLMYVGRHDHQVKLGGVKINPCEVEAMLEQYCGVTKAAVIASKTRLSLVGFIQVLQNHFAFEQVGERVLRFSFQGIEYMTSKAVSTKLSEHLLQHLPKHCIPSHFLYSYVFPCLPSGKIAKSQLPSDVEISNVTPHADTLLQAKSGTEDALIRLFSAILGVGNMNVNTSDDFVSMGGNSLLAIDFSVQLEKNFGLSVPLHDLLSGISIRDLALMIDENSISKKNSIASNRDGNIKPMSGLVNSTKLASDIGISMPISKHNTLDNFPLLLTQHMVWLAQQNLEKKGIVIEIAMECLEAVDVECLKKSVLHLFYHESLRTLIQETKQGAPYRYIIPLDSSELLNLYQLTFCAKKILSSSVLHNEDAPVFEGDQLRLPQFCFNLETGPLWRAMFFEGVKNGDNTINILAFQFHHIIIDGWSLRIIMAELYDTYKHLSAGGKTENIPQQHHGQTSLMGMTDIIKAEHANLQDHISVSKKLDYWVKHLRHCSLPLFLPAEKSFSNSYNETKTSSISRKMTLKSEDTEAALKVYGISEFVLTYSSYLLAVHSVGGSQDVTTYLPVTNRMPASANIVGMVVETMPLRVKINSNMSINGLLHNVKAATLELFQHMHPYVLVDQWVENRGELYISHPLSGHYLQIMFVFDYDRISLFNDSTMFRDIPVCDSFTVCAISFYVHMNQLHNELNVHAIYNTDWFNPNTINAFLDAWETAFKVTSAVNYYGKNVDSLSRHICVPLSSEIIHSSCLGIMNHYASTFAWGASLGVCLGGPLSSTFSSSQMENIIHRIKHVVETQRVTDIAVLQPMSPLLYAVVASVIYLQHDIYMLLDDGALHDYISESSCRSSVLLLLNDHDAFSIFSHNSCEKFDNVFVISTEYFSPILQSSVADNCKMESFPEDSFQRFCSTNKMALACNGFYSCAKLPMAAASDITPQSHSGGQYIKYQDVLSALKCFHSFQLPRGTSVSIFTNPQCCTFPISIALLLEGICSHVYDDADIKKVKSLSDLPGIQNAHLLVAPEILIPKILQDLPQQWPKKQLWIQGLPLGLAHVGQHAEKLFTRVLVTHSLLPNNILITHSFDLQSSTVPPPGTSWMPVGHSLSDLQCKIKHPDGRDVIPGFPGQFAVISEDNVTLLSKSIVRQVTSGKDAGLFQLFSFDSDAYYQGNDATQLVKLLGQLPCIKWCHYLPEHGSVLFDSTDEKSKVVKMILNNLDPSFVPLMYEVAYPSAMTSNFLVDNDIKPSSTCCIVQKPHALSDHYQMVLDKLTGIVSCLFFVKPEEIENTYYLTSLHGYCMENCFQLTLEINDTYKTTLTLRQVSQVMTMDELVKLVLTNK